MKKGDGDSLTVETENGDNSTVEKDKRKSENFYVPPGFFYVPPDFFMCHPDFLCATRIILWCVDFINNFDNA